MIKYRAGSACQAVRRGITVLAVIVGVALPGTLTASADVRTATDGLAGFDISASQGVPDLAAAKAAGAVFAYVKDTAGVGYVNPNFLTQFRAVKAAGLLRGAYHYARPDKSSGADQARYLHSHNGKWFSDGMTLPPAIDLEATDDAPECYGLDPAGMVSWITDFSNTMTRLTGHHPMIYTTTLWWKHCTGNSTAFHGTNPLWLARYNTVPGEVPGGWGQQTFWQYGVVGSLPGNQDSYNGTMDDLQALTVD